MKTLGVGLLSLLFCLVRLTPSFAEPLGEWLQKNPDARIIHSLDRAIRTISESEGTPFHGNVYGASLPHSSGSNWVEVFDSNEKRIFRGLFFFQSKSSATPSLNNIHTENVALTAKLLTVLSQEYFPGLKDLLHLDRVIEFAMTNRYLQSLRFARDLDVYSLPKFEPRPEVIPNSDIAAWERLPLDSAQILKTFFLRIPHYPGAKISVSIEERQSVHLWEGRTYMGEEGSTPAFFSLVRKLSHWELGPSYEEVLEEFVAESAFGLQALFSFLSFMNPAAQTFPVWTGGNKIIKDISIPELLGRLCQNALAVSK